MAVDWERKKEGVAWPDVWHWLDAIRDDFGYWGEIHLAPPMPGKRGPNKYGTLAITLVKYTEGFKAEAIHRWVYLCRPDKVAAEALALQLVVMLHAKLDNDAWEAERATVPAGDR